MATVVSAHRGREPITVCCREVVTSPTLADVAQLVERNLAKVEVAGSIPVVRSTEGGRQDRPLSATWPSG